MERSAKYQLKMVGVLIGIVSRQLRTPVLLAGRIGMENCDVDCWISCRSCSCLAINTRRRNIVRTGLSAT